MSYAAAALNSQCTLSGAFLPVLSAVSTTLYRPGTRHTHLSNAMFGAPLSDAGAYDLTFDEEVERDWLWKRQDFIYELGELIPLPCGRNHILLRW